MFPEITFHIFYTYSQMSLLKTMIVIVSNSSNWSYLNLIYTSICPITFTKIKNGLLCWRKTLHNWKWKEPSRSPSWAEISFIKIGSLGGSTVAECCISMFEALGSSPALLYKQTNKQTAVLPRTIYSLHGLTISSYHKTLSKELENCSTWQSLA